MSTAQWFPEGLDGAEGAFGHTYDSAARAVLPLAQARSIEDTAQLVRLAGFSDVQVHPLHRVLEFELELELELDERYGVAPGHRAQLQYLVRSTRD